MEKIELDGQVYYFIQNKFVDSSFCAVDKQTNEKLCEMFYKNMDFGSFSKERLLEFAKTHKDAQQFAVAKNACVVGTEKFCDDPVFLKQILPIYTSTLRALGQPKKAIEVAQKYTDIAKCDSSALWISVASACCDVCEFKDAIMFLKLAKQKKRDHKFDEDSEFSMVENRIKKALSVDEI